MGRDILGLGGPDSTVKNLETGGSSSSDSDSTKARQRRRMRAVL